MTKQIGRPITTSLIKLACSNCGATIFRKPWDIRKHKAGCCCNKACAHKLISKLLKRRWDTGKMCVAGEKQSKTKREGFKSGKYINWTQGKTKRTDPRIAASSNKISETLTGTQVGAKNNFFGKKHTEVSKALMRKGTIDFLLAHKHRWMPTTPERALIETVAKYQLPYRYTGNGSFWVKGEINPDFVHTTKKIVIEVQGCYWHNCPICFQNGKGFKGNITNDMHKAEVYQRNGFQVIYIWEHEIQDALKIISDKEK